jgi:AcrR family transcriptional regulator
MEDCPPDCGREVAPAWKVGCVDMDEGNATATAAARPMRRDAERNRRLILSAARELFAQRGLDASFEAVAREAGVGVGTLYRHFPNRQALIEALFTDGLERISRIVEESLAAPSGWDGLRHFMAEMLVVQTRDRGLRDVLTHARKTADPGRDLMRARLIEPLGQLVARAQQEGELRADLVAIDVAVLEIAVLSMAEFTGDASPDGWQRYLTIVLDGMRARRDGPTELPIGAMNEDQMDACMTGWKFGFREQRAAPSS